MNNKFMDNLSVKWRLVGFIVFLLLIIAGTGAGGLFGMRHTNQSLSNVYQNQVIPLENMREIQEIFENNILSTISKILYNEIKLEEGLHLIKQAKYDLNEKWSSLHIDKEKKIISQNITTPTTNAKELIITTDEIVTSIISAIEGNNIEKLDLIHDEKIVPLSYEYRAKIDYLIRSRIKEIKNEYTISQKHYLIHKTIFLSVILLSAIICLAGGYVIMNSINRPLAIITEHIKRIMKGDLAGVLDYERKDEFGLLIQGFSQMSTYLSDLVKQIQRSGIQVTSSITEIAAVAKQHEVTANEHAATTSEIAASTTEIAATSANLMKTMKGINSLTKNTAYAAEEGHSGLAKIDETMGKMEKSTGNIVAKLSVLSEKAGNIASVVKTINKVADQTNLLSLNAAIEAEKAGEYGSGFAVVATEIRRLADQTAVATFDIEQMVQDVQSALSSSVMGIDKFAEDVRSSVNEIRVSGEQLAGVIEQVKVLMPQMDTINDGIEAQSLGAKQISEATSQLNEAAQQTAESIAQTSNTITQLQQAAQGLQEAVSLFKVH